MAYDSARAKGTLSIYSEFPSEETLVRRGIFTDAKQGMVQRLQTQSSVGHQSGKKQRREWKLQYNHISKTDRDSIVTLYKESKFGAAPIDYTPSGDSSAVNVRFTDDSLVISRNSAQDYSITAHIQEML